MDGQRMDQIARALANGMSRRGAMKAVAMALGLLAAGALRAPTVAEPTWSGCHYVCAPEDPEDVVTRCMPTRCRQFIHEQGTVCESNGTADCCASSKEDCEAEVFTPLK
jgi:hypothetical protein